MASLEFHVASPERRSALTPDYRLGCKRIVVSDNFLQAMNRPNVDVVANSIVELTETAILDDGGVRREVDAIIFGTGFNANEPHPVRILGRNGLDLREAWKSGVHAYLGTMVPGYPNFFILAGPNSGLGHNSAVFMLEAQMGYVMRSMRLMRSKSYSSIEVRESVEAIFNENLQSNMKNTVWETGCRNWYQDARGKNVAMWPGHSFSFWARTRKIIEADYIFSSCPPKRKDFAGKGDIGVGTSR